jgi:hypothetical protein
MNIYQLGADIGRVLALTPFGISPDSLRSGTQAIIQVLGLDISPQEEAAFELGLGWGCADRRKIPVEQELQDLMEDEDA